MPTSRSDKRRLAVGCLCGGRARPRWRRSPPAASTVDTAGERRRLTTTAAPSDHDLRGAGGPRHAGRDERTGAVAGDRDGAAATTSRDYRPNGTGGDHHPGAHRLGQRDRRGHRPAARCTTRWCAPACRTARSRSRPITSATMPRSASVARLLSAGEGGDAALRRLAGGAVRTTSTTRSYHNFGCAAQQNLAAMVANPADLIRPQPMAPANGARRAKVITDYGAGRQTPSRTSEPDRERHRGG